MAILVLDTGWLDAMINDVGYSGGPYSNIISSLCCFLLHIHAVNDCGCLVVDGTMMGSVGGRSSAVEVV